MQATAAEYYAHLFPYKQLCELLTCSGDELSSIEFALEGEVYKRYVSVRTAAELKAAVTNFPGIKTLHFGAVYSGKPSSSARISAPVRRVLSFDVDLTDKAWIPLKDSRGALSMPQCDKAWPVCAASADILKRLLEEAFGFTRVLVVYSGRRGVHVHVFDDAAMRLGNEGRAAIVSYINGNLGTDQNRAASGVHLVMKMHNMRRWVYLWFTELVTRMGLLDGLSARMAFVERLDLEKYAFLRQELGSLADEVMDKEDGQDAWRHIVAKVSAAKPKAPWVLERLDCALLAYVWPVLDGNVTRDVGHLTKVPFACHATARRVACAVDLANVWDFRPGLDAPAMDDWDQSRMDRALRHFHARGDKEGAGAEAEEGEAEPPATPCDVEDLVPATTNKRSAPVNGSAPPRKLAWKRKPSPLVPTAGQN